LLIINIELRVFGPAMAQDLCLVASSDSRSAPNRLCWPAQQQLGDMVTRARARLDRLVVRGHAVDDVPGPG
jgi:hypothetical protein